MLKRYLDSFFDNEAQKAAFEVACSDTYCDGDILEWFNVGNDFKQMLPYGNLNGFYIEIGESASIFIKKLFNRYVDTDTFVVGAVEHHTIQLCMDNIQDKMILDWKIIKKFDIDTIINQFKQTNCKKIFVYGAGIINFQVVSQSFYIKLKERLVKEGIEHNIVLDDVQGMFIVPRDYSIFDDIIFTCHSLIPNFNSGILLSKQYKRFGYNDVEKLEEFVDTLDLFFEKKDKLLVFNLVLRQYFAEELGKDDIFQIPEYSTLNIFYIKFNDEKIKKILLKYKESLSKDSPIEIGDRSIIIRASFLLRLGTDQALEELSKLKDILQKCIKLKDRLQE